MSISTPVSGFDLPQAEPIPAFVERAIAWLAEAQHADGGWGAGSHARQDLRDPHEVQTDPATTAFAGMALIHAGHTPVAGARSETVRRAVEHLVKLVEAYPEAGPKITDITGTQPQTKLGGLVDTSLAAQFLSRVLMTLPEKHELRARVDGALSKCIRKLQSAQGKDGSWNVAGGWAPVLQTSLSSNAMELALAAGNKDVDKSKLEVGRKYLKGNYDPTSGRANAEAGAGVELYAYAGAQRAAAGEAAEARRLVQEAITNGILPKATPVTYDALYRVVKDEKEATALAQAYAQTEAQTRRMEDQSLLSGFGNNGGEEFISYLLTSESLVLVGGERWTKWNAKMHVVLGNIQNRDGSWSGLHCITSPVVCTAAAIQCLTTDREAPVLAKIASSSGANVAK